MENVKEFKGLNGNLMAFKEEVSDAKKITFAGAPGVCTPFAELLHTRLGIKNRCNITLTDVDSARKMELTPQGMQLTDPADPKRMWWLF